MAEAVFGLGGKVLSKVFGGSKQPKPVSPQPQIINRPNSAVADALTRRRGQSDNQRTGSGGAESTTTGKKRLTGT